MRNLSDYSSKLYRGEIGPVSQMMAAFRCCICFTVRSFGFTPVENTEPVLKCSQHCKAATRHSFIGKRLFAFPKQTNPRLETSDIEGGEHKVLIRRRK